MRPWGPILLPTSLTPALSAPGIMLRGPDHPCAPTRSTAWVHGALLLSEVDVELADDAGWLGSLFVTAVPRAGDPARVAPLCGGQIYLHPHGKPCELQGGAAGRRLPFAFDLEAVLPWPLAAGRYHVFVSARHHRSPPIDVELGGQASDVGPFGEKSAAKTPVDHLVQGYALASVGDWGRSAENFTEAFRDKDVREDLDGANLYNGACSASRAILLHQGREAEQRLTQALNWLSEDLALRRDFMIRKTLAGFHAELAEGAPGCQKAAADELRESTMRHFLFARNEDEDLDTLRRHPPFIALFKDTGYASSRRRAMTISLSG